MSLRNAVGLADLALAYAKLQPRSRGEIKKIARLLGLTSNNPHAATVVPTPVAGQGSPTMEEPVELPPWMRTPELLEPEPVESEPTDWEEYSTGMESPLRKRLDSSAEWGEARPFATVMAKRPVRAEAGELPPPDPMPLAIVEAEPWPLETQGPDTRPLPVPLLRPGIRRAFLRDAVADWQPTGEIDSGRLVNLVARGRWLRQAPKRQVRRVARSMRLLIDTSEAMTPFLHEANQLSELALAMLGCSPGSVTWTDGAPDPESQDLTQPWPAISSGDTVLVISLLGLSEGSEAAERWTAFARTATQRGVRLVALVPARAIHWTHTNQGRFWRFKEWMPPGRRHALATAEHVHSLAALLAMSAHPSPALVRQIRLRSFPGIEPFVESELIGSRWIAGAYRRRLVLNPDGFFALQQRLIRSPALFDQANQSIQSREHLRPHDTPGSALAENLWLDALSADFDAAQRVELVLARLIKTLHLHRAETAFARYASSVLERLPPATRKSPFCELTKALIRNILEQPLDAESASTVAKHQSWLYPDSIEVGIAWNGYKLYFRDRPRSGDALITIPDTPRRQVRIDWSPPFLKREWRSFFQGRRAALAAPELPTAITSLRGQSFTLSQPDEDPLWRELQRSLRERRIISAKILSIISRGDFFDGYLVDVGLVAFLPSSQMLLQGFVTDREAWLESTVDVIVIELSRRSRTVKVSRSQAISETEQDAAYRYLAALQLGEQIDALVTAVTETKVIVQVGPVTSVIFAAEVSWDARVKPADVATVGVILRVVVLSVNPRGGQVRLSVKQLSRDPWEETVSRFPIGRVVNCRVREITDLGIGVDVEDSIPGLIPFVEIDWIIRSKSRRFNDAAAVFVPGQEISAVVFGVGRAGKRLSLSIRQLHPDVWAGATRRFPQGSLVKGRVQQVLANRILVELADGIAGWIRTSNLLPLGTSDHPAAIFAPGQWIDVKVKQISSRRRNVHLGFVRSQPDP